MPSSGGSVSDAPVNKVVDGKSHYLAYITPDEGKSLVDQGGKEVVTDSGIPAYPPWDDPGASPGTSHTGHQPSGGDNGGDGGDGGDDRQTHSPHADTPTQIAEQQQLDIEQQPIIDYEGEAAGTGEIVSNNYDADTGTFDVKQTTGTITAAEYQQSNLETYLNSGEVSDKDKINTLNQLQAIQNSQLVGTKQGTGDVQAKDFVMDNLSSSLDYVKGQTKYSKYTSSINEDTAQTFEDQFRNNPLGTVVKSGGVLMSMGKGLHDRYKNKQAMNILGYTGDVYNPRTGDYGEGGNRMLTGGATPSEREAMTQLAPAAPYIASGTGQPASVAAAWYANLGQGTQGFNFHSAYANAKAKVSQTLGNPSSVGQLAVNQSPFYNWLKDNSLNKGIL
ncbi:MAG: hypothetical protein QF383_01225 [Flavobacteriales bacterium]|nr:hypothetical protein [Flavobacteriales bacterium]